jgi:molybdopterin/thiamine biosynthesis adenylyltransferase
MVAARPEEPTDYSRLDSTVFARTHIRNLRILVVGAGALGNEVVKALGLLGLESVLIVDPDVVEPSNLTRSFLFRTPDAMKSEKASALAEAANRLFPETQFLPFNVEIADLGFGHIAGSDIIFSCVDNDLARLEVAYIANKLNITVVDAGLGTPNYSHGRVSYFPNGGGVCYSCLLTERRRRELLTLWDASGRTCSGGFGEGSDRGFPSTPTMAAIIGSIQVETGLRRVMAQRSGEVVSALSISLELDPNPDTKLIFLKRSAGCPLHGLGGVMVPSATPDVSVRTLLEASAPERPAILELDWPICARARCARCVFRWSPMQRLALFRRTARCPSCASNQIIEEDIIRAIDKDSEWAQFTLSDLGLPKRHLFTIRCAPGDRL